MAYLDNEGYLRYTSEENETMRELGGHFTPQGYKSSQWVTNIMKWIYGDLPINKN